MYGEPNQVPIDESHPVGAVSSPYGRTKFQMEEIIRDHATANKNFQAAVLGTSIRWVLTQVEKLGKIPEGIPDNLVPFVCQVATGKLEKLKVLAGITQPLMVRRFVIIYMWSTWRMLILRL